MWQLPRPIQTWAEATHDEKPAHGRWFDLFFDLVYVGVAFNVGHLVPHLLHEGGSDGGQQQHEHHPDHSELPPSFAYAVGKPLCVFFVLFSAWLSNVQFYARFDVDDAAHKAIDVVEFTAVGIASFHAGRIADHHGRVYQTTGMAVGMWISALVTTLRCAEVTQSPHANARNSAAAILQTNALCLTLIAVAIGVGLESQQDGKVTMINDYTPAGWATEDVVLGILVLAAAVPIVTLFYRVLFRSKQWQQSMVPVHVNFLCHRIGEFTMLMLGESVLTCVTLAAPSSFNGGRFHAAAVAAFAITTCLMYQGYSASQFEAQDHVMRRSGVGGVVWLNNTWAHSFALIVVGVALRLAMARGEQSMTLSESWLLSGSLVASFLFVQLTEFLHTLDGRPGGDSLWTSMQKYCHGVLVLESLAVFAQASVPKLSVSRSWSGYDEVCASAAITMFVSMLQTYDPKSHGLKGRFHEHAHGDEHEHGHDGGAAADSDGGGGGGIINHHQWFTTIFFLLFFAFPAYMYL